MYIHIYTHNFIYKATQIEQIHRDIFISLQNKQEIRSTY